MGQAATRTAIRVHFHHRSVRDTVVVLEDGNSPHPRCPRCDMLYPWSTLNRRHLATVQCTRGVERKRKRLEEEELRESSERAFQAYGESLEYVTKFRYLVRVMTAGDDDWPAVVGNPHKARNSLRRLSRILSQEGADTKLSGNFIGGDTGGVVVWGGDVGTDPRNGADPVLKTTQGPLHFGGQYPRLRPKQQQRLGHRQ